MFQFSGRDKDKSINGSRKPALLSRLDSIKGLMAIAFIAVLVSGAALAGEGNVLDSNLEANNDTAAETAAVVRDGTEEGLNHNRSDSSARLRIPESQDNSNQSEVTVNEDETDINIEVEEESNIKASVDEEGTVRHTYESDDGRTKINVETKNNSSSSNTYTDTSIDIDINSNSSNFDSNDLNNRRRNPHPDRP